MNERLALRLKYSAALLIGLLGSEALNTYERVKIRQLLDQLPGDIPDLNNKVKKEVGLPEDFVIYDAPGSNTAYYVPKLMAKFENLTMPGLEPEERKSRGRYGYIVIDPSWKKPGVLAHEAGHAEIGNKPIYHPSRINQSLAVPISAGFSSIAPLAAVVGGGLIGHQTGSKLTGALAGGGIGLGMGALLNAPQLINEWQATRRAKRFLNNMEEISPEERKQNKKSLNRAFRTYAIADVLAPAITGSAGGALFGG